MKSATVAPRPRPKLPAIRRSAVDAARCATGTSFFFQAEDGIRDLTVTGVQTCALPISIGDRLGLVAAKIMRRPLHIFNRAVKLSNGGCNSWMLPQLFLRCFLREADLRECKGAENAHS